VIVADTGAVLALIDADDQHHAALSGIYREAPDDWVLPWAILPEVDYLLASHVSQKAADDFLADLDDGRFRVEWGGDGDLTRARQIVGKHRALKLGLVDGVVMAVAERVRAKAIATLDLRHFGAVTIRGNPKLLPRDG
jgi:predicted nucleic acid-binding protein